MHDPMTVAFDVKVPIPRLTSWGRVPPDSRGPVIVRRRRYTPAQEGHPLDGKPMHNPLRPAAWIVWAFGKQVKMRTLATIWHVEPGGHDSGEVCSHWKRDKRTGNKVDNSWRWHVHHWKLQFPWLQDIQRSLFQRCAWCGGRSTRHNPVNVSYGYGSGDEPMHAWSSRPGVYHSPCTSIHDAYRSCLCDVPELETFTDHTGRVHTRGYGQCQRCGGSTPYGGLDEPVKAVHRWVRNRVPRGAAPPPEVTAQIRARWKILRGVQ